MENASKALIIAGAILLSILIIALGIFVFNAAKGAIKTDQLDATEKATFNDPIAQYEGRQLGSSVKSLLSHLISNAGNNSDAAERLPDVTYKNVGGPVIKLTVDGTETSIAKDGTLKIESTVAGTNIAFMSQLRSKISQTHYYNVEIGYDDTTGLVNSVTINY